MIDAISRKWNFMGMEPSVASHFVSPAREPSSSLSLQKLVGAHPHTLLDLYRRGQVARPDELGMHPAGKILALDAGTHMHMLSRNITRTLSKWFVIWQGKTFDHGGNSGTNRVMGQSMFRFRVQQQPSLLDGKPTTTLRYDVFGHPWPVSDIVDELRLVGDGVAIGPMFLKIGGSMRLIAWWGLQRSLL